MELINETFEWAEDMGPCQCFKMGTRIEIAKFGEVALVKGRVTLKSLKAIADEFFEGKPYGFMPGRDTWMIRNLEGWRPIAEFEAKYDAMRWVISSHLPFKVNVKDLKLVDIKMEVNQEEGYVSVSEVDEGN